MDVPDATAKAGTASSALLTELLRQIRADLPGSLGTAITVRRHHGPLTVVATDGVAEYLVSAQVQHFGGPVPDAARHDEPQVTGQVFTDPRWPRLTLDALTTCVPHLARQWTRVAGVAALPTPWHDTGTVVLSAILEHAADHATVTTLSRYRKLVTMTLVVSEATTGGIDQMVALLQSHAAIEEAKGAIVAARHCGPDEAWTTLRRASQEFNVKLRELAAALIEHLGDAPAPRPDAIPPIIPTTAARHAAATLWAALTTRT